MADQKITALAQQVGANIDPANDVLVAVDVSDTSMGAGGTDKKLTVNDLTASQLGADILIGLGWALP